MEIWELDRYQTPRKKVLNSSIIEYDMKSANISLAKEFHLLPEKKIKELEALPKKDRVVQIGLYKREHKDYNEKEKAAFTEARRMFFDRNELSKNRVVSIKRDAIFVEGQVLETKLTDNIEFRPKNEYTSYMEVSPLELYYAKGKPLEVKGIDSQIYLEKHHDYFGRYLEEFFRVYEMASSRKNALMFLKDFATEYKWRRIAPECYREFNSRSRYLYRDGKYYDILVLPESLMIQHNYDFIGKMILQMM